MGPYSVFSSIEYDIEYDERGKLYCKLGNLLEDVVKNIKYSFRV